MERAENMHNGFDTNDVHPQEIDEKTLVSNECFYFHKRIELTRNNSEMVAFVFI